MNNTLINMKDNIARQSMLYRKSDNDKHLYRIVSINKLLLEKDLDYLFRAYGEEVANLIINNKTL